MNETQTSGGRDRLASLAGQRLAAGRIACIEQYLKPPADGSGQHLPPAAAAGAFVRAHSDLVDRFLCERLAEIAPEGGLPGKEPVAVVAVGGYGRRELCVHSDLDLLLVSEKTIPPQALDLAQPLFLTLWDLGYDLGHGFRTIRDCLDLSVTDFQVLASLLDLRLIAGDPGVFAQLQKRLRRKVLAKKARPFLAWLQEGMQQRRLAHGANAARLEPQLKDGPGGLRDYHTMLWLGHFLDEPLAEPTVSGLEYCLPQPGDRAAFLAHVDCVFAARNQLHLARGRKNELLHLELQPAIATALGYAGETPAQGVEAFLAELLHAMTCIDAACGSVWRGYAASLLRNGTASEPELVAPGILRTEQGLELLPEAALDLVEGRDPLLPLRMFLQCARLDEKPAWSARNDISRATDAEPLRSPEAWNLFLEILTSGNAAQALAQMAETGFLDRFLPPFAAVRHLVQFDAFHTYPVGWHTIETLRNLEQLQELREAEPAQDAASGRMARLTQLWVGQWQELKDRRALLLAALFHDLGKGRDHHELRGAELARTFLEERGTPRQLVEDVVFLVERHLLLMQTATRQDLGDEAVVLRCANQVGTVERLRMLSLLAYADARATGPKAWSDWTAGLLAELCDKVLHMLKEGHLVGPRAVQAILKARDGVRSLARKQPGLVLSGEELEAALERMPPQYLLRVPPTEIVGHLELARRLERELEDEVRRLGALRAGRGLAVLDAHPLEDGGIWRLSVAAKNQSGLFATLAGVLSLHDLNIFAADTFIWGDGMIVALVKVSAPVDPLYADEFWVRVRGALKYAMTGKLSLDYRLDRKRNSALAARNLRPGAVSVNLDNESTDFFTVIEVLAWDRPGLLYEIAHCLHTLQIEVHMAKVATHFDQAADYFYVRDAYGQKIEDPAQMHEVRQALLHRLSR